MYQAQQPTAEAARRAQQVPADAAPARLAKSAMSARPPDDSSMASVSLGRAIDRIEEVVEQETAALRNRAQVDLKDFNNRKSHGLLELTRAMRLFEIGELGEPQRARLAGLRAKLEKNRAALEMHLEAVREISTMMAEAVQDAESDGTYSESAVRAGLKSCSS